MKLGNLVRVASLICIAGPVLAQTPPPLTTEKVIVTGSSIKRVESEGALPVQVITRAEIDRQGIVSAEQLVATLTSNGNGMYNLASNADVVAGQDRGNNGASAANLRGQGASATLILVNGRRVAAHGLNGGVVDLNSIPIAAVERVEVLKDGASAIYGTDAIGGVINFILYKSYTGLNVEAFADQTQKSGGEIARLSMVGGIGDLAKDGFNVMVSLAHSENKVLRGDQRDFVNTFQSDRGLSVDTRGTPFATAFALSSVRTILSSRTSPTSAISNGTGPLEPNGTVRMNGINALDIPGQPGCNSISGMDAYDERLWATPAAKYGCAWDTGRAAVLQQPVKNTNVAARAAFNVGPHMFFGELTGADVETAKRFSASQISSSTSSTNPFLNLVYPSTGSSYNYVFNTILAQFPSIQENYGQGIAYRWRCLECGEREITTDAKTARLVLGAEGSFGSWDYRAGVSRAYSDVKSTLGNGYFFNDLFVPALASGLVNPFLLPGQSQTPAALAALAAASARGVVLYGGKFTLTQADASASGPIFKMPAGDVMAAFGVDVRREEYKFQGDERDLANQRAIFNAPFDAVNVLGGVKRDIKAIYTEVMVPLAKTLELTMAVRRDEYTGFGSTVNPKVSLRFVPVEQVLFRGSYNTGFRVPTFNQLFNGTTISPTSGATIVDPAKCPALAVSATPGCESILPNTAFGGKADLGPEKSKQGSVGVVWAPMREFSANADWWQINRTGTIQSLPLATIQANYGLFSDRYTRDATGNITLIDTSWINAGETLTRGIDVGAKLSGKLSAGRYNATIDGSYLTDKKSRLVPGVPWGPSEVAVFSRSGDLGLRWKHIATFTYAQGDWSATVTQSYSSAYKDAVLPGVLNGSVSPPNLDPTVHSYTLYNVSTTYSGFKNLRLTFGIKNLFNQDPPFSAAYDTNTGAGSSWEPRVADPRGRSFTALASYKFF